MEKPAVEEAMRLLTLGALVNVFIVAGSVGALLGMYRKVHADAVTMLSAVLRSSRGDFAQLVDTYEQLPVIDFSHDILTHQAASLRVLPVPHCGWTDLGKPERVAEVLKTAPRQWSVAAPRSTASAYLSLAAQWMATE